MLVTSGERASLRHVARLLSLASAHLLELADAEDPAVPQRRGRPRIEPEAWQIDEVLRLRHANGRLGYRAIGEKVDLSWHLVQRILDAASEKDALPSEKPSDDGKRGAA